MNITITLELILFFMFLALKLAGEIAWSWVWVFSPLWIGFAIAGAFLFAFFVVKAIGAIVSLPFNIIETRRRNRFE